MRHQDPWQNDADRVTRRWAPSVAPPVTVVVHDHTIPVRRPTSFLTVALVAANAAVWSHVAFTLLG